MRMIRYILAVACALVVSQGSHAQRFHCETDTVKAMEIIREFYKPGGNPSEICGAIASRLVGAPYVPITKQDSVGEAVIRLDGFDEMSFINTVAALAKTATSPGYARPKDLELMLQRLTFRHGEPNGFPSILVYGGDWVVDNRSRGNVRELTEDYSNSFKTKSLEWVGRHPQDYAALKDSATFERQKMVEFGFRTFKIPHMKRESTEWKQIAADICEGDLIILLSSNPEKDVRDIGFLVKRPDGMHFIHASETAGKVVEEEEPIGRYIRRHAKDIYGWRWLRIL